MEYNEQNFVWIVEEYDIIGYDQWSWEFSDAFATEDDADEYIKSQENSDFFRKRCIEIKRFNK